MNKYLYFFLLFAAISLQAGATDATKPAAPFVNPYLAASTNSVTHKGSSRVSVAGPVGPSRQLKYGEEIQWAKVGPVNGWDVMISGPYPNGKRVIWVGGYDRIAKVDADTMEVLTTYAIGGNTYFGEDEIERYISTMDRLSGQKLIDYAKNLWQEPLKAVNTGYHMLSSDNEYYMSYIAPDGTMSVRAYGEADPKDPASKITLRREWKYPTEFQHTDVYPMSMSMTSDGWIVLVLGDGNMFVVSRDFSQYHSLKLPRLKGIDKSSKDFFASFVRNSASVDDHGGIFVVSRDYLQRVQWTGSKLSLDEADGGWKATYPNEQGIGSGTTPQPVGWGPDEDHLVVIADGAKGNNNMLVFWRDKIPDDWKGLPGLDRRIAGRTPISFGDPKQTVRIENSPVVYGYGVFFNNTEPAKHLPDQGSFVNQFMFEVFDMFEPDHAALGGGMIRWDPKERKLIPVWSTQQNLVSGVCKVSDVTNMAYCWGARNKEWTVEGFDWNTGKNIFHYTLGKSMRYNPIGGTIVVAPDGAIICGCTGGFGSIRVKPKEMHAAKK